MDRNTTQDKKNTITSNVIRSFVVSFMGFYNGLLENYYKVNKTATDKVEIVNNH